jgi:hypothetical protein
MRKTTFTKLLKQPSFTSTEARARGISSSLLAYYVKKGEIERLSRGVYRGNESIRKEIPFEWEDLITTFEAFPTEEFVSSPPLPYDLTYEIPRQFWIAIPNEQFGRKDRRLK